MFMGKTTTYKQFTVEVDTCAKALRAIGIKEGDKITICMPNCPQAVIMFYAVNVVGAIANMIHPLSSENEIVNQFLELLPQIQIEITKFLTDTVVNFKNLAHKLC